jgi:hypothetical protein
MQTLKTLCNVCQAPMTCEWPDNMTYGGEAVTAREYMEKALRNDKTLIVCEECLAKMPDVNLEDMRLAP